jgi:hypothetical protein
MASTPSLELKSTPPRSGRVSKTSSHTKKTKQRGGSHKRASVDLVLRNQARTVLSLKKKVESKTRVIKYTDGPQPLLVDGPTYEYLITDESKLMNSAIVNVLGSTVYRARLGTVLNMSSSAGGIVNSTLATSTLGSVTEFASFTAIFNEFFLQHMRVTWQPNSLYNGPMTYLPATTVASLPIGITDLQHSQNAYSSLTLMADSPGMKLENTGKSFVHTWTNVEKHTDVSLPFVPGTSTTQSWCQVASAGLYSGMLHIISQAAPPGLPVSSVLGTFLVEYDVYFRNRY